MKIVIIGSGNVATVLGRKFKAAGHTILQIFSRNSSTSSALAYEFDSESTNYKSMINKSADVYIIAVADNAIDEIVNDLNLKGKVVAHTAASVPKEILKSVSDHYGVFYPLQSLRSEMSAVPEIPIFYDGNDATSKHILKQLAQSISPEKAVEANDDDRLKLHVAAVVVNNFVSHLYYLAEEYCRIEGIDFKQLLPLIEETTSRLKDNSSAKTQTGPAVRNDRETIHKHLELLSAHPQLKNIYILLTESIQQSA